MNDDSRDRDHDFERRHKPAPRKGMGLASLILGVCALVTSPASICCLPIGFVCGLLGITFGSLSFKTEGRGMGIAGLVLSSVGVLVSVVLLAVIVLSDVSENRGQGAGWWKLLAVRAP